MKQAGFSSQTQAAKGWQTALILVLAGLLYFTGLGDSPISDPDEGLYAEMPREMVESDDVVTPACDYAPYLDKPPLMLWFTAALYKVAGISELTARAVTAAAGLMGVAVVIFLGRSLFGGPVGSVAGLFYATSAGTLLYSRQLLLDQTLTTLLSASLLWAWRAMRSESEAARGKAALLAGAAAGGAALAKGLVGPVIAGGAVALAWLWDSSLRSKLRRKEVLLAAAAFAAVCVPWHLLAMRRNPQFLSLYILNEQILRFLKHREPMDYESLSPPVFLATAALWAFPWILTFSAAAAAFRGSGWGSHERETRLGDRAAVRFLLSWVTVSLGFFIVSRARLVTYSLPAVPALMLLLARGWTSLAQNDAPARVKRLALPAALLPAVAVTGMLVWFRMRSGTLVALCSDPRLPGVGSAAFGTMTLAAWSSLFFLGRAKPRIALGAAATGAVALCAAMGWGLSVYNQGRSFRELVAELPPECLAPGGCIVLEHPPEYEEVGGLCFYTRKKVWILRQDDRPGPPSAQADGKRFVLEKDEFRELWNSSVAACFITQPGAGPGPPVPGLSYYRIWKQLHGRWVVTNR